MGRWAQAQRGGGVSSAAVLATPVASDIVWTPAWYVYWTCTPSPAWFEIELDVSNPGWVEAWRGTAPGSARSAAVPGSFLESKAYRLRVRGWVDGRPGDWSGYYTESSPGE